MDSDRVGLGALGRERLGVRAEAHLAQPAVQIFGHAPIRLPGPHYSDFETGVHRCSLAARFAGPLGAYGESGGAYAVTVVTDRAGLTGGGLGQAPSPRSWVMVILATVIGWGLAIFLFSRFRRRIAYWV